MGRQLALRLMEMISTGECDDRNYTYVMKPILYDGHSIRKIQKGKIKILPEASNCSPGESLYRFCCARKCAAVCRRGSSIGKELLIRCAKAVASRGIPISLASAPAEQLISTCCAFRRAVCGPVPEMSGLWENQAHLQRYSGSDLPKLPLIQNIKVTGIKASVTFYGKIMSTGTGGSAGGRRHSQQDTQIVLKIANADIMCLVAAADTKYQRRRTENDHKVPALENMPALQSYQVGQDMG